MGGEIAMGENGWEKGPIWANHKVDRDFKIAIVAGWERMGNWKWERVGKLRWGKMSGKRGVRKLEKRGQPKGDCVDLKIAIWDAGKNGTECELKILGESIHTGRVFEKFQFEKQKIEI
ncbi:uncharacterized protein Gasu_64270 [Galdieria sulphuraria]|uniref:Uncharacterized protein n=1 Tax=Galdieria sulphuraria TaxID=130081 RepID=M2XR65_GALSU|nr:uncharacterized protein Gasu_64270 [Galdieria sulphuraria]EME25914.1 hypothetical protein Gasu_64270 [Galdieria sulphuraria]|eukprot:XP_005702434.1 hypothetical protein Gasu_64270 [Galdieria sulphuraria]